MERIKFREVSDLGKTLQKSAQFLRQNFIGIMKSSLLVVFAPFLLGAFLTGSSMSGFYADFGANMEDPSLYTDPFAFFKSIFLGYILIAIAFMMFYIICISYIKQYVNGVEIIDHNSVFGELKKHFLKVFFGGILIGIITYVGMIFCLIPGIYFSIIFSHFFAIAIIEDKGFGESFSKSFSIIKGQFWESFLLYFVSTFIVIGISFIVILPMYIFMGVSMFRNLDANNPEAMFDNMSYIGWFMPLYLLVYLVIIMLTAIIQSVNYYNLVEIQEGVGEKNDIENIGN